MLGSPLTGSQYAWLAVDRFSYAWLAVGRLSYAWLAVGRLE